MPAPAIAITAVRIGATLVRGAKLFRVGTVKAVKVGSKTLRKSRIKLQRATKKRRIASARKRRNDRIFNERFKQLQARGILDIKKGTGVVGGLIKNIIQRPLNALLNLLGAWVLDNLPEILRRIRVFTKRIKVLVGVLRKTFSAIGGTFDSIKNIVVALYENIINFDFSDKSGKIQAAKDQLDVNIKEIQLGVEEFQNVWDREERELDIFIEGLKDEETIKKALDIVAEDIESERAAQPQTPAVGEGASTTPSTTATGGSAEDYRIAAAIASESGPGQSAVDVLQVAANRVASSAYPNNFTDVFAQSGQFEGVFSRSVSEFKAISSAEDAARWLGGGATPDLIERYINDLRNPEYRRKAANDIAGAVQFRANPSYYRENGLVPGQMNKQGRFTDSFYRGGRGDNQFFTTPGDQGAGTTASPLPAIGRSTTPSTPSQTPPRATATPRNNTGVIDELNVATNESPLGGLTAGSGFRSASRPTHNGIDIGTYGARGFKVSLNANGSVSRISNDPTGYGKFVIITVPSMNRSFMFAHLQTVYLKQGQKYNGEAIGEIGNTGNSDDVHLHFECYIGGANGQAINPAPYLNLLSIGRGLRKSANSNNINPTASQRATSFANAAQSMPTGEIENNKILIIESSKTYIPTR